MASHTCSFLPGEAANFLLTGQQWSSFNQDVSLSLCLCVCVSLSLFLSPSPHLLFTLAEFFEQKLNISCCVSLFFFLRHIRLTSASNNYFFFYKAITFCHSITRLHVYRYFYKHIFPLLLITWERLTKRLSLQDTKHSNKSRCNRRSFWAVSWGFFFLWRCGISLLKSKVRSDSRLRCC